jgi:antitoxin VapB
MAFYIKDDATDKAVRRLAKRKGKSLTETVREAVERELKATEEAKSLGEVLDELTARFSKIRRSGKKADKAFYDELSGET